MLLLGLLLVFWFSLHFVGRRRHQLCLGRCVKTTITNATNTHGGHTTTTEEVTGKGDKTIERSGDTVPV